MRPLLILALLSGAIACKKAKPKEPDAPAATAPAAARSTHPSGQQPTTQPSRARQKLPPGHPPLGHGGGMASPALRYTAPKSWSRQAPKTRMRKAQFLLPAAPGAQPTQLVVYHFRGTGGSVQDNLQRWFGQFKQPGGAPSSKVARVKAVTVNGLKVTKVYLPGTYLKSARPMMMRGPKTPVPNQALLAAIVETAHGPWFFKAVGDKATIDANRAAFDKFVATFKAK